MKTDASLRFLCFLLWTSAVFFTALFLFTGGFLLRRQELHERSACLNVSQPSCTTVLPQFSKAVIVVIDALKYDFALYNESLRSEDVKPFQNRLPALHNLQGGRLFKFVADPPTTTMQRLKGLTTGNLPTFIDVSSNFASYEIMEDNIIDQLVSHGRRVVFAGDDTWLGLFPHRFSRAYPYPSFDVWDLDTVDTGVSKHLFEELSRPEDWDVLIVHYLGVDHAGHKFGPNHSEMSRKLDEMNQVLERVMKTLPHDCILFVMGDHGMTTTGDHGGDSSEELEAALYLYSNKNVYKPLNGTVTVNQVDFVPTFSLLLGLPIPFSNLGAFISDAIQTEESLPAMKLLQYVGLNVDQVFRYLETYQRLSSSSEGRGSPLQTSSYENAISQVAQFRTRRNSVLKPAEAKTILQLGSGVLSQVKTMCLAAFVEFDVPRITSGLTLSFLHLCLLTVLALVPKHALLKKFISYDLLAGLGLVLVFGSTLIGISFLLNTEVKDSTMNVFAIVISITASLMIFGFTLLWRLRHSVKDIFRSLIVTDVVCWLHYAMYILMVAGLFSNSFVVNEASLVAFCCTTSLSLQFISSLKRERNWLHFLMALTTLGLLRCVRIYFRCREEHLGYCDPSDFHKSIGTLPSDVSRDYKNIRFFFTIFSVYGVIQLPYLLLKVCGNLNGMSVPVMITSYAPWVAGIAMVCHWALQGLPTHMATKLLPWQHYVFAQFAWAVSALIIVVVPVGCPNLTYLVREQRHREIPKSVDNVGAFFNLIKSNWRQNQTAQTSTRHRTVYGLGTGLSAPFVVFAMLISLASMLVLGDGLCPSMALAVILAGLYLYVTSLNRLDLLTREKINELDLMQTPWSVVIGWYCLECLFFYGSGHQPTFPTIQWSAAFVGFPSDESSVLFRSQLLPAILIGWNTYAFRILFAILLPLLMISPFSVWMLKFSSKSNNDKMAVGEMFLIEREEESKSQMFRLCTIYFVLQGIRLFSAMLSAAVLRRHLMVWKIFAPRFIFEGIGFIVSAVAVLLGYCLYVRIHNTMSKYLQDLYRDKDK